MSNKKKLIKKAAEKLLLAGVLSFGAVSLPSIVVAQTPPLQGPPAPPPPGELLKRINPFKKNKKSATVKKDSTASTSSQAQTPPVPPNPIDIIKGKKFPAPPPHTPPPGT